MPHIISGPSFQSLYIELMSNDQVLSCATAFLAKANTERYFLITNRHNVTGRDQNSDVCLSPMAAIPDAMRIMHNSSTELGHFVEKTEPLFRDGASCWIEHPVHGAAADVVALPLTDTVGIASYPYKAAYLYAEPPGLAVADQINVVGFPFGLRAGRSFAVWATGYVATEPSIDYDGKPTFLIDCRTRKGQSGSPVIRPWVRGGRHSIQPIGNDPVTLGPELLGVYSGRINPESDLGIVWKTHVIAGLIDYAGAQGGKEQRL